MHRQNNDPNNYPNNYQNNYQSNVQAQPNQHFQSSPPPQNHYETIKEQEVPLFDETSHINNTSEKQENDSSGKSSAKQSGTSKKESKENKGIASLLSGIFPDGKLDNDKIIIIALIVLLAKEGADLKLLLALGYILI